MTDRPTDRSTWLIQINDEQRLALIEVIKASDLKFTRGDPDQSNEGPLGYWIEMLQQLPDQDDGSTDPRQMIHGFCL